MNWQRLFSIVMLAAALSSSSTATFTQDGSATDSGTFQILLSQKKVGTEKFRISRGPSGWEATAELQLSAPASTVETSTLRLDSSMRPTYYERQQKSPTSGSITAQFAKAGTSLVSVTPAGSKEETFYLPENLLVVLDTNFFHDYAFLIRQYDASSAGAQPFNVFIPQEALPGSINLEFVGNENIKTGSSSKSLDHYRATTDELQMDIWATPDKLIQRIEIPNASLEIVRQ